MKVGKKMKCYCCRTAFEKNGDDEEILKIKMLFRSVLILAGRDAFLLRAYGQKNKAMKHEALNFLAGGTDLKIVCELAGVNEKNIESLMKENLSNNLKYRKFILYVKNEN